MTIDETAERVMRLPPDRVAAYAMDWRNDPARTQGIHTAKLTKEADGGGFGAGAEVTRTAYFLGRRIDYVLSVSAHEPPRLLDMVSVAGPIPMHVTYTFAPYPQGTLARIRVRGDAGRFSSAAAATRRSTGPRCLLPLGRQLFLDDAGAAVDAVRHGAPGVVGVECGLQAGTVRGRTGRVRDFQFGEVTDRDEAGADPVVPFGRVLAEQDVGEGAGVGGLRRPAGSGP